MAKYYLKSKTFWFNLIMGTALVVQHLYGFEIAVDEQKALLVVGNLALRAITGESLSLKNSEEP